MGSSIISIFLHAINPDLNPAMLLGFIIDHYSYVGLKGIIITGIAALIMSTADSHINAASVIFTSEILNKKNGNEQTNLIFCRISAITIGIFSIFLAISKKNILSLMLMSASFYIPIVTVPLTLAILGFRSSSRVVLTSMIVGGITVVIWRLFFMDLGVDSVIPGMLANLCSLFVLHYLLKEPGGWVGVKDRSALSSIQYSRKVALKNFIASIKTFNLFDFLVNNAPKKDITYTLFGIFALVSSLSTVYVNAAYISTNSIIIAIYQIMLIMPALFISFPIWPNTVKNRYFISIFWFLGIFYLLAFCSSFFILLSNFAKFQVIIFTLNLVIVFLLNRCRIAFFIIFLGMIIAVNTYSKLSLPVSDPIFINYYNIAYILLMLSTAVVVFIIPKERALELVDNMNKELSIKNLESNKSWLQEIQYREQFLKTLNEKCILLFKSLNKEATKLSDKKIKYESTAKFSRNVNKLQKISNKLTLGAEYLNRMIYDFSHHLTMRLSEVNIMEFIVNVIKKHKDSYNLTVYCDFDEENILLEIYPEFIKKAIDIIIEHGVQHSKDNSLKIQIKNIELEYKLSMEEITSKKEAIQIDLIFEGSNLTEKDVFYNFDDLICREEQDLQFMEIYKIISAHFGKFNLTANNKEELIYSITIPYYLKSIYPKK